MHCSARIVLDFGTGHYLPGGRYPIAVCEIAAAWISAVSATG